MIGMRVMAFVAALVLGAAVGANAAAAAERLGYCGVVQAYTAATQSSDGSVTVGSRTFAIAAGTENEGTHEPTVGEKRCVMGETDEQRRFNGFFSVEASLIESTCGEVLAFTPATDSSDGSLTVQTAARPPVTYLVPAGTALPSTFPAGQNCFALDVNAAGDAIVTGTAPPAPEGGAAATSPPATLPSTSTGEVASLTAVALVLLIGATALAIIYKRA